MVRTLKKVFSIVFILGIFENSISSASESSRRRKLFFLQKSSGGDDNDVLLKVTLSETEEVNLKGCKIYTGKDLIDKVLRSSNNSPIRTLPEAEMQNLLRDCKEFNLGKKEGKKGTGAVLSDETENAIYFGMSMIFPGTKWCGLGSTAEDYNDLGSNLDIDRCCRAHDLCNDYLPPGKALGNLINTSWLPLLSCECDVEFYKCLKGVNSFASNTILNLYFNFFNKACFVLNYPFTDRCKSYYTFLKIKCSEYERNTTAPKVYQLATAMKYKEIPVLGPLTTEEP